ncbi:MAG: hypothetical protein XU11_C0023G0037 [Candidatus Dadabacteria bacterium CSP1-2]|jgi:hypothetical protein|nr:MAG: hypothetical protein XU11_C0023G0037 [Candidatus Dadabacteria bacterium CSP1-2]
MKREAFLLISSILLVSLGCAREWQNPNTTIPAKQVDIAAILENPIAFDSAGVIVEGKVWDLVFDKFEREDKETPFTEFKLADKDGNFVKVFVLGHIPIAEGDIVEVLGIYRRELGKERIYLANEIEAIRVEKKKQQLKANN